MSVRNTATYTVYDEAGATFLISEFRTFGKHANLARGQSVEVAGEPTLSVTVDGKVRSVIDMHGSDDYDCPPRTVFKDETGTLYLHENACT